MSAKQGKDVGTQRVHTSQVAPGGVAVRSGVIGRATVAVEKGRGTGGVQMHPRDLFSWEASLNAAHVACFQVLFSLCVRIS